ncbi:uncharacterized protein LOC117182613 [Belonocnema kinseyi]|uniref:uncharacterized protein LOC117182613 n=1 Tax=Belonocnema kinseyi TaxID=2817044 RepID=UPI00143DA16B|nr:uncharacterized protein LOC117182613 [Belonocnema kinseyi]
MRSLLIDHNHRHCLPGGIQLTLETFRQTYWILRGRSVVKAFLHRCLPCLHRAVKPQQLMADLPAIRSTPFRPFLHTGVDYAGPVYLRTTKGRGYRSYKCSIAVFVCCSTQAIHLEAVSDYKADVFLADNYRFITRRGICATLTSDQGTNFVRADVKLRAMFLAASKESTVLASCHASHDTERLFNPPGAPHFGGI